MDWSKAKTILIAALLITNIILGSFYIGSKNREKAGEEAAAEQAVAYAAARGVSLSCPFPEAVDRLPVLFVKIQETGAAQQEEYRGIPLEAPDLEGARAVPEKEGDTSGELISPASALLKFVDSVSGAGQDAVTVTDMELVYLVYGGSQGDSLGSALEDTAVPAWKFTAGGEACYVEALAQ